MDRRAIGQAAEDVAARFLTERGATIVARNFRRRLGEIDLIAQLGQTLLIVEVRTRSSERYGGAAASVDFHKQQRGLRAAQRLLQEVPELAKLRARFDVIVVSEPQSARPRVNWIEHAFSAG